MQESKFEALGMRAKCLLAVCLQSTLESLSISGRRVATPPYLAPPSVSSVNMDGDEPLVAIGTLDVQVSHEVSLSCDCVTMVTMNCDRGLPIEIPNSRNAM